MNLRTFTGNPMSKEIVAEQIKKKELEQEVINTLQVEQREFIIEDDEEKLEEFTSATNELLFAVKHLEWLGHSPHDVCQYSTDVEVGKCFGLMKDLIAFCDNGFYPHHDEKEGSDEYWGRIEKIRSFIHDNIEKRCRSKFPYVMFKRKDGRTIAVAIFPFGKGRAVSNYMIIRMVRLFEQFRSESKITDEELQKAIEDYVSNDLEEEVCLQKYLTIPHSISYLEDGNLSVISGTSKVIAVYLGGCQQDEMFKFMPEGKKGYDDYVLKPLEEIRKMVDDGTVEKLIAEGNENTDVEKEYGECLECHAPLLEEGVVKTGTTCITFKTLNLCEIGKVEANREYQFCSDEHRNAYFEKLGLPNIMDRVLGIERG